MPLEPLNRTWIMAHIPHQGRMCLLDEVTQWDADRILCRSTNHRDADNPLRAYDRLGVLCGIEYAAQAMAVHAALAAGALGHADDTDAAPGTAANAAVATDPPAPVAGFLAALRGVTLHVTRLDDVPGTLLIAAAKVAGDRASALYEFEVGSTVRCLVSGRATVILDAQGRLQP